MLVYSVLFLIALAVEKSQSYNMTPVTATPMNKTSHVLPQDELLEFEMHRSLNLQVVTGRLRLEDTVDLCEAVTRDDSTFIEMGENKLYYQIPVTSRNGLDVPIFEVPCYGWKRRGCIGIPKPPFDYRCFYWTPFSTGDCNSYERKKRMARPYDPITVSGLEAVVLCATASSLGDIATNIAQVQIASVALPTNEASVVRCINWKLSPEGGWYKEELETPACDIQNAKRPIGPYLDNEINTEEDVEDVFSDIIKCESRNQRIDCIFQKQYGIFK